MHEDDLLKSVIEERRKEAGPPPSEADLLAYLKDELPVDEEEVIREHLAHDGELAELIADLKNFTELRSEQSEEPLSAGDLAADWEKIGARCDLSPGPVIGTADTAVSPSPASPINGVSTGNSAHEPSLPYWQLLAAAVLLTIIGAVFGFWLRPWFESQGLTADIHVAELLAENEVVRAAQPPADGSTPPVAHLPTEAGPYLLILHLVDPPHPAPYRIEIARADNPTAPSLITSTVSRQVDGSWTLLLQKNALKPGRYRIRLYGTSSGGSPALLATYLAELDEPSLTP